MGLREKIQEKKEEYTQRQHIYNTLALEENHPKGLKNKITLYRKALSIYRNTYK